MNSSSQCDLQDLGGCDAIIQNVFAYATNLSQQASNQNAWIPLGGMVLGSPVSLWGINPGASVITQEVQQAQDWIYNQLIAYQKLDGLSRVYSK